MTGLLNLLDNEIAELRWALLHYWKKGDRRRAQDCYWELQGVRRSRRIAEVYVRVWEGKAA